MATPALHTLFKRLAWSVAAGLALVGALQIHRLVKGQAEVEAAVRAKGRAEARRIALAIEQNLKALEPKVDHLAEDLSAGKVRANDLPQVLKDILVTVPGAFRVGVVYGPYAKDPGHRLFAPYAVREQGQIRAYDMATLVDYTLQPWYWAGMGSDGWGEPHLSATTRQVVAGYSRRFTAPDRRAGPPAGQVRVDLSMEGIRAILATASLGRTGYSALLSAQGVFLAHPREDLVTDHKTVFDLAGEQGGAAWWAAGEWALRGEAGEIETVSLLGHQPILLFAQPVPAAHWSLQACLFKEEVAQSPVVARRRLINITLALLGCLACLGLVGTGASTGSLDKLWRWQVLLAALLAGGIAALWWLTLALPDPPVDQAVPIIDQENLDKYLKNRLSNQASNSSAMGEGLRIPTGLFVETLRFGEGNDVMASGRIWQRYPEGFPADGVKGVTLPDAEQADFKEVARRPEGKAEWVQYEFRARVRQRLDSTTKYPFDHAVIRLRLRPRDPTRNFVLVPDLSAYRVVSPVSLPGLEKSIRLSGWNQERSYFGFLEPAYDTSFGAPAAEAQERPPELSFQLTLSRKFLDPFISAMLPAIVVACLLFTLLMAGTKDKERVVATGFKATDILRAAATLLFPVIYAQINLRSRIASGGLLYLEYFYFVMYAVILLVAVNALAFALGSGRLVHRWDNAVAKLLYWPVVLGAAFGISLVFLY